MADIVADGCGRGAVDFALKSVSWSVTSGARTQPCDPPLLLLLAKCISNEAGVSRRGGVRRGYGVIDSGKYRIGRTHGATNVSSPDLPILRAGFKVYRFRGSFSASCGRTVYTIKNFSGYN